MRTHAIIEMCAYLRPASERGDCFQIRHTMDRRFWATSGVRAAVMFGVMDDYGDIVASNERPKGHPSWRYADCD